MDFKDGERISVKLSKKKVKKTVKVRKEVPYNFEKEVIVRQSRCFPVVDRFMPMRKVFPITGKFYSKYEQKDSGTEHFQNSKFDHLIGYKSFAQNSFTVLESQTYGWTPKQIDKKFIHQLNFIYAPKKREDLTIFGEKLFCEKVTQRPKFNGIRFYSQ